MPERFSFDTSVFSDEEAFGRYHDFYARGADAVQLGPDFAAKVDAFRLDGLILFNRSLTDLGVDRLAPRVRRDGFDHFTLQLNRGGAFHGDAEAGFKAVEPGEMLLLDMAKPMRTRMPDAQLVTVSLARDLVEAAAGRADHLHGCVIPAGQGGLLADFLCSLTQRAPDLPVQAAPGVTRAMVELLRIALGQATADSVEAAKPRIDGLRLATARRFIEANLASPDLGPEAVARAAGMSRATLYRVFDEVGGVSKYIQGRRLARLCAKLRDPAETLPVAQLANLCGFASESHASRSFLKEFGMRPAEFRDRSREAQASSPDDETADMKRRFASWESEVR